MPTTISTQEFVAKWRKVTANEKKIAQQHFIDLCHLLGEPTPAEADPSGKWYCLEAGASRADGGQGWADVFYRGKFGCEYKGKHADLGKAYTQLLLYGGSLENHPLLIISDIDSIIIHTNFTHTVKPDIIITLDDLLTLQAVAQLKDIFQNPEAFKSKETPQHVTEQAAKEFSRLAKLLRDYRSEAHTATHFLIHIPFCLFAKKSWRRDSTPNNGKRRGTNRRDSDAVALSV